MRRVRRLVLGTASFWALAWCTVACSGGSVDRARDAGTLSDAAPPADGGPRRDAGSGLDSGSGFDGSSGTDASEVDGGRAVPLSWIVGSDVVVAIQRANAGLSDHFFDHPTTYERGSVPSGYLATPMAGYQSYATFSTAVAAGSIPAGVVAVRYDNESWSSTPLVEQNDPATYMAMFTTLAHAHGYVVVLTPARDLMSVSTAVCHTEAGENLDHAYLRCGIPAAAVRTGAEVFEIQSQSDETTTATYTAFTRAAITQARAVSTSVIILAGLTTMRTGDTAALMEAATASVLPAGYPHVAGFWLNVRSGTPSEVTMAVDFLTRLETDGY